MNKTQIIVGLVALLITCLLAPIFFYAGPVPLTMQTLVLFTMAAVLGKRLGILIAAIYIILGAIGLPVFAAWQSGYEHLLGRTAGFLWAFPFVCYYIGWQVEIGEKTYIHTIIYFFRAHLILLISGAIVAYGNYGGELVDGIIRLLPGLLIKSGVGGLLSFWLIKKLPSKWTGASSIQQ
ncbi:biotin transporter BioY [Owenweeksia hongkongensis]|uniref:biotin transporter BioY n=1 Tax=Owenweeksia hongkongensis TaxID=253245 RepID=UPI003A947952